jgi:hypothetical protein
MLDAKRLASPQETRRRQATKIKLRIGHLGLHAVGLARAHFGSANLAAAGGHNHAIKADAVARGAAVTHYDLGGVRAADRRADLATRMKLEAADVVADFGHGYLKRQSEPFALLRVAINLCYLVCYLDR